MKKMFIKQFKMMQDFSGDSPGVQKAEWTGLEN
jgi:hypothetical protein